MDCGASIFKPEQDVKAGGSGCGCSAVVLNGYLLKQIMSGKYNRVLFMATGALLQPGQLPAGGIGARHRPCRRAGKEGVSVEEINWLQYLYAFLVGGAICVIAQIIMDKTKMNAGKILVLFVTAGVILGAFGIYQKLVDFAGAGASIPLLGFGNTLARGAMKGCGGERDIGRVHRGNHCFERGRCRRHFLRLSQCNFV